MSIRFGTVKGVAKGLFIGKSKGYYILSYCCGTCCIYSLPPTGERNNVVWWRLLDTRVCGDLEVLLVCVVHVGGSGRVVLPLPVPSPCNNVVMVLGTGASFVEGFVSVVEANVNSSTGNGRSCGTNCCGLCPLTLVCQSRPRMEDL